MADSVNCDSHDMTRGSSSSEDAVLASTKLNASTATATDERTSPTVISGNKQEVDAGVDADHLVSRLEHTFNHRDDSPASQLGPADQRLSDKGLPGEDLIVASIHESAQLPELRPDIPTKESEGIEPPSKSAKQLDDSAQPPLSAKTADKRLRSDSPAELLDSKDHPGNPAERLDNKDDSESPSKGLDSKGLVATPARYSSPPAQIEPISTHKKKSKSKPSTPTKKGLPCSLKGSSPTTSLSANPPASPQVERPQYPKLTTNLVHRLDGSSIQPDESQNERAGSMVPPSSFSKAPSSPPKENRYPKLAGQHLVTELHPPQSNSAKSNSLTKLPTSPPPSKNLITETTKPSARDYVIGSSFWAAHNGSRYTVDPDTQPFTFGGEESLAQRLAGTKQFEEPEYKQDALNSARRSLPNCLQKLLRTPIGQRQGTAAHHALVGLKLDAAVNYEISTVLVDLYKLRLELAESPKGSDKEQVISYFIAESPLKQGKEGCDVVIPARSWADQLHEWYSTLPDGDELPEGSRQAVAKHAIYLHKQLEQLRVKFREDHRRGSNPPGERSEIIAYNAAARQRSSSVNSDLVIRDDAETWEQIKWNIGTHAFIQDIVAAGLSIQSDALPSPGVWSQNEPEPFLETFLRQIPMHLLRPRKDSAKSLSHIDKCFIKADDPSHVMFIEADARVASTKADIAQHPIPPPALIERLGIDYERLEVLRSVLSRARSDTDQVNDGGDEAAKPKAKKKKNKKKSKAKNEIPGTEGDAPEFLNGKEKPAQKGEGMRSPAGKQEAEVGPESSVGESKESLVAKPTLAVPERGDASKQPAEPVEKPTTAHATGLGINLRGGNGGNSGDGWTVPRGQEWGGGKGRKNGRVGKGRRG